MSTSRLNINPSGVLEGCSNPGRDLLIPEGVTAIADWAFYGCTGLARVVIPGSVTRIGGSSFYGCTALTSVTISEGVKEIGDSAFWHCASLSSVAIPKSVTSIGGEAFSSCASLTSVTIPKGVAEIAYRTFSGCTGLTSVTISEGVKSIGRSAFSGCGALTSVDIPESVTEIGGWAFYDCASLTSVLLSEGLEKIGERAFSGCVGLTSVSIPVSVGSISNQTFSNCVSLSWVSIPESVTKIGDGAFSGCVSLGELRLPGKQAAMGADFIEEGTAILAPKIPITAIPAQWKQNAILGFSRLIGARAVISEDVQTSYLKYIRSQRKRFYGLALETPELMTLMMSERMIPQTDLDELLRKASEGGNAEISALLREYRQLDLKPKVPAADRSSGDAQKAEEPAKKETTAELKRIWVYKKNRSGGISLTKYKGDESHVTIPARIGKSIVTELGEKLFWRNKTLQGVTIPAGVTKISGEAFSGCTNLKAWKISPKNRNFYSENGALIRKRGRVLLCWPSAPDLTSVVIPKGVTEIGESLFSGCMDLTSVTIPEGVTKIGSWAFYGCKGLTGVTLPESLTRIDSWAFYGCTGLTSVAIPAGVTKIGERAFSSCESLTRMTIPESVGAIDSSAFWDCPGLRDLHLPEKNAVTEKKRGETADGGSADQEGPISITIPEGVTKIGDRAFKDCAGLSGIIIPAGVKSIGSQAFSGCVGLERLVFPSSVEEIASDAFENCPRLILYVPNGSAAMKYAEERNFRFRAL